MGINKDYQKKIEDIKVEGEDFANSAMKDVYFEQKEALDELHKAVAKIYIDHAKDGLLNLNTTQKNQIISDIKEKLKAMGIKLGKSEVAQVTSILGSVFATTYYKNAFVLDSGLKGSVKFNILKSEFVDNAVNQEYKGEKFSDRIWKNKADMIDVLQSSIIDAMKGNVHLDKVGRNISETFNSTAYESQRLVMTETARIQSQAQDQIGMDSGCKEQMYTATLDGKTALECAALDGKIYDINDPEKVVPPENHPNCRCVLINVPYAGWNPTARKDNETKDIIDYKDYASWAKSKGISED